MYTLMNAVPPGPNRPNVNMNLLTSFFEQPFVYPNTVFPAAIIIAKLSIFMGGSSVLGLWEKKKASRT